MRLIELFANSCLWLTGSQYRFLFEVVFSYLLYSDRCKVFWNPLSSKYHFQVNEAILITAFLLPIASKKNAYLGFMLLRIVESICNNLAKQNMHVLDHQDGILFGALVE